MSKSEKLKYAIYGIAFLMMLSLVIFIPKVANSSAIFYQSIIAAFLGIDVAITLKTTNSLPEGEFKKIKTGRYLFSGITSFVLFATSVVLTKLNGIDLGSALSVFVSGVFVIMAMYIGCYEGNKFLTFGDPSLKEKIETPAPLDEEGSR